MKLNIKGKIVIGIFDVVTALTALWCLITIVFRRDEAIWLWAVAILTVVGCVSAMVHDEINAHIRLKKHLYEQSFR